MTHIPPTTDKIVSVILGFMEAEINVYLVMAVVDNVMDLKPIIV